MSTSPLSTFLEKLCPRPSAFTPETCEHKHSVVSLHAKKGAILCKCSVAEAWLPLHLLHEVMPAYWQSYIGSTPKDEQVTIRLCKVGATEELAGEAYRLTLHPDQWLAEASTAEGLARAATTIRQLLRVEANDKTNIPCGVITDRPNFPVRGVMLDVSRGRIPRLEELYRFVDRMMELKLNHLELYMEHTFAYSQHPKVWQNTDPYTADDMRALDAYCRARFVQLVANQNSLGHCENWLKYPEYENLAELPEGGAPLPWGGVQEESTGLCPTSPEVDAFLDGLYDELLPCFSNPLVNIGCDETFDLGLGRSKAAAEAKGKGRVYLEFLQRRHAALAKRGRKMAFWGDIILNHPELIPELPKDCTAIHWGYEADNDYEESYKKFKEAGIEFWVAPGTSSWRSIGGRYSNMCANIRNAVKAGLHHGASGVLVTDWGDAGHWQTYPIMFPGLVQTAALSWNADDTPNLADILNMHLFMDQTGHTGKVIIGLAQVSENAGACVPNASLFFKGLFMKPRHKISECVYKATHEQLTALVDALSEAKPEVTDSALLIRELKMSITFFLFAIDTLISDESKDKETFLNSNYTDQLCKMEQTFITTWRARGYRAELCRAFDYLNQVGKVNPYHDDDDNH